MVATSPVAIERAFAHRHVRVARMTHLPELCDRGSGTCMGIDVWGGRRVVYLAPLRGGDFVVIVFERRADTLRVARLEGTNPLVGTESYESALLVYLASSRRIARLRAALAASG